MNYADSEEIAGVLEGAGYIPVSEPRDASVIVLNTCSVRQRAEDKVLGLGRKMAQLKRDDPDRKIIVTGCMGQRLQRNSDKCEPDPKYLRKLQRNMPWVDHFMEIGDLEKLNEIIDNSSNNIAEPFSKVQANVPISIGCDNFCSYCIVPYTRGPEKSLPFEKIIGSVQNYIGDGYKLVSLLGQNVNSWQGEIDGEKAGFAELLDHVSQIEGDFWINFLSSNPMDFSTEIIESIAKNEKIVRWVNLAVQSGSDRILKKMNRKYTRADFIELAGKLREKVPGLRLSTDLIVGFPGEMEDDFRETLELVKKLKFDMAYIAEYSQRDGTAAARMKDDVPRKIKKQRKKTLQEEINKNISDRNSKKIGKQIRVLIMDDGSGKSHDFQDVDIIGDKIPGPGKFAKIEVTSASPAGLKGRIIV